jgi:hypothetical protein
MSLQTQQLGLCRNHGPIFGKENSNRFEAKNSKNMELIIDKKNSRKTLWFLFFQSVWGFWQFRRNLAAASKPIRTMNIQKRRSIRVRTSWIIKLFVWQNCTIWWPAVLLFFQHWRSIFSALPLTQKHRVLPIYSTLLRISIDCVLKWRSRGVAWSTHCHFRPSAHCKKKKRTSACDERIAIYIIYHRSTCVSQCTWTSFTAPPHPMMSLAHQ